jgi:hypothetical protein
MVEERWDGGEPLEGRGCVVHPRVGVSEYWGPARSKKVLKWYLQDNVSSMPL